MKCAICRHGHTESGFTTVTLERNQTTLLKQAEQELQRGVFLEMVNYG